MKNSFGSSLTVTLFGESHGEMLGATIDGLAPGIKINHEYIKNKLDERRPADKTATARRERDEYRIVSGERNGFTTGAPLTLLIPNENTKSSDYESLRDTPRPSHADYTAECKYHGYQDYRGGGHFSGRITAALVAAGALVAAALEARGIYIGTHIARIGAVSDDSFLELREDELKSAITALDTPAPAFLNAERGRKMTEEILRAAECGDSVGGALESCIIGMPSGVGEPWFDSMESQIAHILFSIPAVKGVEFGRGFGLCEMRGSEANDVYYTDGRKIKTKTNNNGGILGGITSGMPIIVRTAIKPTPSIYTEQDTVSLSNMTNTRLKISGRHDPAIVGRARAVADAALAIAVADMLAVRYGTDWLSGK
ncbi:MAG: chorismate synthase [Clostridia bacterium]|nr:chorismate synthase [Clostridia bacterium]